MAPRDRQLLVLIGGVSFAAALAAHFAIQGGTLFLRAGDVSSGVIGLLSVAAIPYTLRFLWAPLVDRNPLGRHGRYSGWIVWTQAATCLAMAALALSDPVESPGVIVALISLFMIARGTQVTAVSGLMTAGLSQAAYPNGSSTQAATSALGAVFLGEAVLYLLADMGWIVVAATLSVF